MLYIPSKLRDTIDPVIENLIETLVSVHEPSMTDASLSIAYVISKLLDYEDIDDMETVVGMLGVLELCKTQVNVKLHKLIQQRHYEHG